MAQRKGERVGNPRKIHPLPMRLRNPHVPREIGGAEGTRGPGWTTIRKKILARDKNRSTITGFTARQGNGLQVDHINPFRLGGKNRLHNLRTTDFANNSKADFATSAREKKPRRNQRW